MNCSSYVFFTASGVMGVLAVRMYLQHRRKPLMPRPRWQKRRLAVNAASVAALIGVSRAFMACSGNLLDGYFYNHVLAYLLAALALVSYTSVHKKLAIAAFFYVAVVYNYLLFAGKTVDLQTYRYWLVLLLAVFLLELVERRRRGLPLGMFDSQL